MPPDRKVKPKRILAIDDVPAFTKLVKLNLESTGGYQVCIVNNSEAALEAAHEFHPDLILLDLVMSKVDGKEVATQLRSDPETRDTPIIFLSAMTAGSGTRSGLTDMDGEHFVPKPVLRRELLDAIEEVMEKGA